MGRNNTYMDKFLADYLAPEPNTSETKSERLWRQHGTLAKLDELVMLVLAVSPNSAPEAIAVMFIRMTREPVWTGTIRIVLERLEDRGLVESSADDRYTVTGAGEEALETTAGLGIIH
jgi:DNA-binding PadR family transcriptional regulator